MGKLLRNITIGLAMNLAFRKFSQAAGSVADNVEWEMESIRKQDMSIGLREGKIVGLVTIRLRIVNKNPISIYLKGYNASIYQDGMKLGTVSTTDPNIELPSNQERILTTQFVVVGEQFVERAEQLLGGQGSLMSPIDIEGNVIINNGIVMPLSQKIEFWAFT